MLTDIITTEEVISIFFYTQPLSSPSLCIGSVWAFVGSEGMSKKSL
jgi:hypothetical protein